MTDQRVGRRALVSGLVQGVFYRDSARREALRRGVAGSARNLPDGRVEVLLEGPPDAVAAVLEWLGRGPTHARVDTVEVTDEPVRGATQLRHRLTGNGRPDRREAPSGQGRGLTRRCGVSRAGGAARGRSGRGWTRWSPG